MSTTSIATAPRPSALPTPSAATGVQVTQSGGVTTVQLTLAQLERAAGTGGVVGTFPFGQLRFDRAKGAVVMEARRGGPESHKDLRSPQGTRYLEPGDQIVLAKGTTAYELLDPDDERVLHRFRIVLDAVPEKPGTPAPAAASGRSDFGAAPSGSKVELGSATSALQAAVPVGGEPRPAPAAPPSVTGAAAVGAPPRRPAAQRLLREVQLTGSGGSPEYADRLGFTLNSPWGGADLDAERKAGRITGDVAFMLAAWGEKIEEAKADGFDLRQAASLDVFGKPAQPSWYVEEHGLTDTLTLSLNSPIFFEYLKKEGRWAVDNLDYLLIDEPMTYAGLMGLEPKDAGFGPDDLRVYDEHLAATHRRTLREHLVAAHGLPALSDAQLCALLGLRRVADLNVAAVLRRKPADAGASSGLLARVQQSLLTEYRDFHQVQSQKRVAEYVDYVRSYARQRGKDFPIAGNVGVGNLANWTPLATPILANKLDFVVSEMVPNGDALLPKGRLLPSFKVAQAISRGRPFGLLSVGHSTMLNGRMKEGKRHTTMNALYLLEGLANRTNYTLGWMDGPQSFIKSKDHDAIKPVLEFVNRHRPVFEQQPLAKHRVGVLFGNEALLRGQNAFTAYAGVAQGLADQGYQFDVIHAGDARFNDIPIDVEAAAKHDVIVVPMANAVTAMQVDALRQLERRGVKLVFVGERDPKLAGLGQHVSAEVGRAYAKDGDPSHLRALTTAMGRAPDVTGAPASVGVTVDRAADGRVSVVHLLNTQYDAAKDAVTATAPMRLRVEAPPSASGRLVAVLLQPDGQQRELPVTVRDGRAEVDVPSLTLYGALVVGQEDQARALARPQATTPAPTAKPKG